MELMFIALFGAIIGIVARYGMPNRELHGSVLVPAIGVAAASVVWVALTWMGMRWDGGWIWTITIVVTIVVVIVADLLIGHHRRQSDELLLETLGKAGPV